MNLEELPEGWLALSLRSLVSSEDGITYGVLKPGPRCTDGVPMLRVGDLQAGCIDDSDIYPISSQLDREYRRTKLKGGEVVVSVQGSVGRVAIVPDHLAGANISRTLAVIPLLERQLAPWLWVALQAPPTQQRMQDVISGTTRDSLNLRDLRLLEIPIPPLAEQRRIVAAVDTLFARINATRERLRRALSILKRFRRAVLATACSGRATADWRKEHPESQPPHESDEGPFDLPEPWKWVRFGKLLQSLRSGSTVPPQNEPTAFPILRSSSVRPGFVDLQDVRYLKEEDSDNADNYLREGDLLFTRLSGSLEFVGNCARVPPLAGKAIQYPDRLFCAKLADPSQGCYFVFAFAAPFVREELTKGAKSSAGHQRISMSNITKQTVPLPSLAEQNEVVRRVDALYALADRIEAKLAAARRRVERLTQAVLTKAFRGELVPTEAELARREGRDYEPASVLLERIRAERERQPDGKARKGRHGRQSGKKER